MNCLHHLHSFTSTCHDCITVDKPVLLSVLYVSWSAGPAICHYCYGLKYTESFLQFWSVVFCSTTCASINNFYLVPEDLLIREDSFELQSIYLSTISLKNKRGQCLVYIWRFTYEVISFTFQRQHHCYVLKYSSTSNTSFLLITLQKVLQWYG